MNKTKMNKKNYLTKKLKAKKMIHKYLAIITFLFILPMAVIGHFETLLLADLEAREYASTPIITKEAFAEEVEVYEVKSGTIREVTMYSSTPEQTDASPCIGATGQNVCELWKSGINICASNAFPLHTIITVDKLGECLVIDRMNKRYTNRIDWYAGYDDDCLDGVDNGDDCPNYRRAWNFGKQNLSVYSI